MNGDPQEIINRLRAQGRSDDYIVNALVYSPSFNMEMNQARSVVGSTAEESSVPEPRQSYTIKSIDAETALQLPEPEGVPEEEGEGERETWFQFAEDITADIPVLGGLVEYIGDVSKSFYGGAVDATASTELLTSVSGFGSDEDYAKIASTIEESGKRGLSDEAKMLEDQLKETEGYWSRMYLRGTNVTATSELFANSLGQMTAGIPILGEAGVYGTALGSGVALGTATAAAGAATGALAGTPFGGVGAAPGAAVGSGIGFGTGFFRGFMGGMSGAIDAQATVMEMVREELRERKLDPTEENIKAIFEDEEYRKEMANMAAARGLVIGAVDAITFGAGSMITKPMAVAGKSAFKRGVVSTGVEALGGSTGEALAQLSTTGEIDWEEVTLEGVLEAPMGAVNLVGAMNPSYKINKGRASRQDIVDLINSDEYIVGDIDVKRDSELSKIVEEKRKSQKPQAEELAREIRAEAARRGKQVQGIGIDRAVGHAFKAATQAKSQGNTTAYNDAIGKAIEHVSNRYQNTGVFDIDINEQSSTQRSRSMAASRYDSKSNEAHSMLERARRVREEAKNAPSKTERSTLNDLAKSIEEEANAIIAERMDFYRKAVLRSPEVARQIQQIDIDNHKIEKALESTTLTEEAKKDLTNTFKSNVEKRVALERSLTDDTTSLTPKEKSVSHFEESSSKSKDIDSEIEKTQDKLDSLEEEMGTQMADPDAIEETRNKLNELKQEKSVIDGLINDYKKAQREYEMASEDLGGEAANLDELKAAEKKMVETGEALAAALGVVEEQTVSDKPSYSSESQLKAHLENGGSTFSLSLGDLIGQKKSSVSIFPDRSKIIEGREITKEDIDLYIQENKDLFEGNEDVLAVGTWFDEQSNQTYLDVSAVVGKKVAVDLGKQYNQKAVFDLELLEEVDTGGTGEVVGDLKPLQERVKDIREALKVGPEETTDTSASSDTEAIDAAVEESRPETETKTDNQTAATGEIPESAVETPRAKDGTPAWRSGVGNITANEAKTLNGLQRLLDVLGVKMYVYPDSDSAALYESGNWGGLYDPKTKTVHINPSQIRENAAIEAKGLDRTKTFAETVMEEVLHAALPMAHMFDTNPAKAKSIRAEIRKALSRDKALLERIDAKVDSYRKEGVSEAVLFEEEVHEFLSALAADPSSVNLKVADRIRLAINKMIATVYGKAGKEFMIKDTDSLIAIAGKFAAAKNGGAFMSSRRDGVQDTNSRASKMVSPAKLTKNADGKVEVKMNVPIYRTIRGLKKDIGSETITKEFTDQWHFINWWKKATKMGEDSYYSGFLDSNGTPIDVERIKGYNVRMSTLISPTQISKDINSKAAAAVSQGILGAAVAPVVRRRVGSMMRKIATLEKKGRTDSNFYKRELEKLKSFGRHLDSVIQKEEKATGKRFTYGGGSDLMASRIISNEAIQNGTSALDVEAISDQLESITGDRPNGRVASYQAMFEHLMTAFPNPDDRKQHFIGLLGKYIADPDLMSDSFGDRNPLMFFEDWNKESTRVVQGMLDSGKITGNLQDNIAKLNVLAALTSAKNKALPNINAALWMLQESEKYKKDNQLGITEAFIKKTTGPKGPDGLSGVTKRAVRVGLRKLMAVTNGDLSEFNVPVTAKDALTSVTSLKGNFNGESDVSWKDMISFFLAPFEGSQVKVEGYTMSQKIFGNKIGAWMINLNSGNYGNMNNSAGQSMSDIVTVDTHVLNTGALALGHFYDARGVAFDIRGLRRLKDIITDYKTEGFTDYEIETLEAAQYHISTPKSQRKADHQSAIFWASSIVNKELKWAETTISELEIEGGNEEIIKAIERQVDKVTNPQVTESNVVKRKVANLISEATSQINERFGSNYSPAQIGQLMFADRQAFNYVMFEEDGTQRRPLKYEGYADAAQHLMPPSGQPSVSNERRASQLLMFPSEPQQDAANSPLFRNRDISEVSLMRDGRKITNKLVDDALSSDATSVRIMSKNKEVEQGQKVGIRLNLNVMKNTGVPVQTMHNKTASGEALRYSPAVTVRNANLFVNQNARQKIVTFQENKFPMASVNGEFVTDQLDQMSFDGVKAFFNPFNHNVFVDASGRPIKSAEEATIIGSTVFLRGEIEYYDFNDPVLKRGKMETDADIELRTTRSPKYDKAVNRFKAFASRNGIEYDSRVELEAAYDNLTVDSKVALSESEVAANMEDAQRRASSLLKIRQTAGKQARKYGGETRSSILENPKNYFTPQSIKDLKGVLSEKSDQELISYMSEEGLGRLQDRNDDMGVLAAGELIARAVSRGDMDAIPDIIAEAAAMGTTAGRILRHFRELKGSTPQGIEQIIRTAVEKRGNKLTEDQEARLQDMAGNLFRLQAEHEALVKRAISGEDVDAELASKAKEVKAAERILDTFVNGVVERGWGELGTMLIQGNLLTPMSQITNVGANMVNALGKVAVDAIALPIERLINAFGIESPMKRNYSINAYMYGIRKFGTGFVEALDSIVTGQESDVSEWRVHRGFAPFRSLMSATGRGDLPMGADGKASLMQRIKLTVQGTLGVPAEVMFRFLSLGDVPFRRYVEGIELYQAAKNQGLEGEALKQFIKHPTKKDLEAAAREGRKLTYQEQTGASKAAEDTAAFFERMIAKGFEWIPGVDPKAMAKFLVRSNMPYIRTPANILIDTLTYVSPYVAGPRIMNNLKNGEARDAAQNFGKLVVGSMVAQTAVLMVKEGVISGAIEWDEDEEKNLAYDQFPPNSINISAVKRMLKGESTEKQKDDYFASYTKLGVMGAIMGAIVKGVDKEEVRKRDYSGMQFPIHALQDSFGVGAFSSIAYMMDQSFMQGMNTLVDVISSADATDFEKNFENWFRTTFQAVSATTFPNTLSAIYRSDREYLPDTRVTKDMPLSERIVTRMAYTIKDRTFGLGDVPVRVNWKGEPIKQTPRGNNGIAYQLFDITKSRQGEADSVSNEIWRLYEQTEDLTKAVGTPTYAAKRKLNVPNVRKKHLKTIKRMNKEYTWVNDNEFMDERLYLNTDQMNRLMAASGKERYAEMEAFMATERYAKLDDEAKVEALNDIAGNYNSAIEMNGNRFREHTVVLFDILQEIYDSER
jgi:hypothetical protein